MSKIPANDSGSEKDQLKGKSYSGIPEAVFVENVDEYMAQPDNDNSPDKVLRRMEEQLSKYRFMEINLVAKKRKLKSRIPDLLKSLEILKHLVEQKKEGSDSETEYCLSDQVYMKAVIPPTDKVCLWLGANVMLEYSVKEASDLLKENAGGAQKMMGQLEHDLDFLRDQVTTTEVNMARVYNWDVKRRQTLKAAE